ncbi:MAG: nucleotidyltransferase family protein [Xanthobacteraceae bacterium]
MLQPPAERIAAAGGRPEFRLTAACCRWPPSESRDAAIQSTVAEVTDWPSFLGMVKRQRVAGLVHSALSVAAVEIPSAIARQIAAAAQQVAKQSLLLAAETIRLHRLFEAANIPAVALKGAALAQLAYGTLSIKHARDIDFLVPPDCAEAAIELLEREDYALVSPARSLSAGQRRALIQYGREVELAHRRNGIRVELQWRIADNAELLKGVDARSETQVVRLYDGASVRTLAAADLFAALSVHGAVHAWTRMKWLADLSAMIESGGTDIEKLYRHAQAVGAGLCAGQALLLCRDLFDLHVPESVAAEIRDNRKIKKLVSIALAAMTAPRPRTDLTRGLMTIARNYNDEFLLGEGWSYFFAQCRNVAVGPADVIRWPLPRKFHFLYPVLRLPLLLWRRGKSASSRGP